MRTRIGIALLFLAAIAVAQQPYFESLEVRLHNLDVVVTDAKGKPVRGLTQEDFVILDDGVPQKVTNFSAYDVPSPRAKSASPTQTAVNVESDPAPRHVAFFVDDMSLQKMVRTNLIKNASALLDQLRPGDLAAVVRPVGENRMPQPFTTDLAAARKVLAREVETCKMYFTPVDLYVRDIDKAAQSRFGEAAGPGTAEATDVAFTKKQFVERENAKMRHRLAQLRSVVASMAGIEGRKILVILTDGMPAIPGRVVADSVDAMFLNLDHLVTEWDEGGNFTPLIEEVGRLAAANGVTIYSIEPQIPLGMILGNGVGAGSGRRSATTGSSLAAQQSMANDRARLEQPLVNRDFTGELQNNRAQTLRALAEKTGGAWTRGSGTIDDLFRGISSDISVYYSLAYHAQGAAGKPRRLQVSVRNRPDLKVRTRSDVIERTPQREMGDLVASTLLFPRDVNELQMSIETGTPKRGSSTVYLPVDVVIPLESLTFLRSGDAKYSASVDIHFAASGFEKPSFISGHQRQTVEISEAQFAARKGIKYRFKSGLEIWPGRTRVALGAMDATSQLVGFRTAEVEAP